MVIGILIKFSFEKHSPLKYSRIRNFSSLVPKTIMCQSEEWCLRFESLADNLYSLGKITAQVADNAKNQFDKFIQAASFEHQESFLKFNFTEDCPKEVLQDNLQEKSLILQRLVYDYV